MVIGSWAKNCSSVFLSSIVLEWLMNMLSRTVTKATEPTSTSYVTRATRKITAETVTFDFGYAHQ